MTDYTRELTRREFVRLALGLGVGLAAADWVWQWFRAHNDPLAQAAHASTTGPYWAMVIDLDKCIGCNRCAYACQATNDTQDDNLWNIVLPVEDTYKKPVFLPRPCMHCENAPCVQVCPVHATYHREDGLVAMNYDLCIGCRYCMVACPYGVRVFNWGERSETDNAQLTMTTTAEDGTVKRQGPWGAKEVEWRPRGVVEKCTFCAHRIDAAQERGLTPGKDLAATPACCNICPTEARVFGDLRDPDSPASRAMASRQAVVLRAEIGTKPRVFYLLPV